MFHRYLDRIEKIASFLAQAPHPDQALECLSLNISPIDEVSVVSRAFVNVDGEMRVENLQGFSKYEVMTKTSLHISQSRPITTAARTQKIVWSFRDTVKEEFPDFFQFDDHTPWQCSVSIPIGLTRVYGIVFPSDIRIFEGVNSYIESLRALLAIYESAVDLKNNVGSRTYIDSSTLQPLSQRQQTILDLLKSGKTNKEIADAISFSESLVRHETMIIYKKLRVTGRHELRESV